MATIGRVQVQSDEVFSMISYLRSWWGWVTRRDWELVDVIRGPAEGRFATMMHPYFWSVWRHKATGEERVVSET